MMFYRNLIEKLSSFDGFVKCPSAALPDILRRCGVQPNYASLLWICAPCIWILRFCAPGPAKRGRAFYEAIALATFYEIISFNSTEKYYLASQLASP
ncbi:MAG: hypothetical protein NTY64_22035 [Deltaproteobacteria bacterium]|nr:hypothetical protein [Deltaproteobacteria bacterium]